MRSLRPMAWLSLAVAACGGDSGTSPTDGAAAVVADLSATLDAADAGAAGCGGIQSFIPDWVRGAKPSTDIYASPAGDDANDGSAAKPVKTAARAMSLLAPGVRVNFAAGNYGCPRFIQNLLASTATPAIVRSTDGPRAAKFDCGGTGDFYFSRATGVILDGLEIANTAGHGVQLDSGSPFDPNALSGDFVLMNSFVHDNQLAGIKVAQSRRVYVIGNEFARAGAGRQNVEFVATDAVTIVGNDAHHSDAFDEVKGGAHGGVIALNTIHDMNAGGGGILVGGDCTGQQFLVDPKVDFEARDLLVWGNSISGADSFAFRIVGCHDCLVANNTYWSPAPKAILRILHDAFASPGSGNCDIPLHNLRVRIANNLFAWPAGGIWVIPSDEDPANVVFEHNLWFASGGDVTKYGSDMPFLNEPTSLYNADPKLVAPPANMNIGAGSAARAAGIAIDTVPGNHDGACWGRPPDIGAF